MKICSYMYTYWFHYSHLFEEFWVMKCCGLTNDQLLFCLHGKADSRPYGHQLLYINWIPDGTKESVFEDGMILLQDQCCKLKSSLETWYRFCELRHLLMSETPGVPVRGHVEILNQFFTTVFRVWCNSTDISDRTTISSIFWRIVLKPFAGWWGKHTHILVCIYMNNIKSPKFSFPTTNR